MTVLEPDGSRNQRYRSVTMCRICGGARAEMTVALDAVPDLDRPGDCYTLLRCANCGYVATDPYPTDEQIVDLYASGDSTDYEFPDASLASWVKRQLAIRQIRAIARKGDVRPKRILDFGTGAGRYADAAAAAFPNALVIGTDFRLEPPTGSYFDAAVANLRYHTYSDVVASPERFDLVFARHVLEHTQDPIAVVRGWIEMLSPGGVLYVEVPNLLSGTARLLSRRWPLLYVPKHLSHFTRRTLGTVMRKASAAATIARCEMPMMGNVLAIASGNSRYDPRFRVPGVLAHPIQLALEAVTGQGTCLYAIARRD